MIPSKASDASLSFKRSTAPNLSGTIRYDFTFRDAHGEVSTSVGVNSEMFTGSLISPHKIIFDEVKKHLLEHLGFSEDRWNAAAPFVAYALLLEYPNV